MDLREHRRRADNALATARAERAQARQERKALAAARAHLAAAKEARRIAQEVAAAVQEAAHARVADVVSRSLAAVFDESAYEFKILFEAKRGRTEARLVFVRDGEEADPLSAAGGGAVDVAAFALRLSVLLLSRPPRRRLLVLDEPFRMLSREYAPRARLLLEMLSRELGVQIIMVTHNADLAAGRVYRL